MKTRYAIALAAVMAMVPGGAYADTLPHTLREATIYCEQNLDAREADATGKHFKACASRIMQSRKR